MKLQIASRLAIFALLELAAQPDRQLSVGEIGEKYGVSSHHLAKVMHTLGRAGLVHSMRGAGGGYQFSGNVRRATLLNVIQLFENFGSAGGEDAVEQYRDLFADMRAKMVFVSTPLLPVAQAAAAEVASVKQIIVAGGGPDQLPRLEALLAAEREPAASAATCAGEVAYWLYSSGTTGMPKGVMHVYSSLMYMARLAGERLGIREDDLVFPAAKAFFAYMDREIRLSARGRSKQATLRTVFETLRSHQPTMFYRVPTLYAAILADPNCVR